LTHDTKAAAALLGRDRHGHLLVHLAVAPSRPNAIPAEVDLDIVGALVYGLPCVSNATFGRVTDLVRTCWTFASRL
jgi:hypothetical protein